MLTGCNPSGSGDEQASAGVPALEGSAWRLVRIQSLNDYSWTPDEPADYVLRFRSENRLEGTSDCNRVGATWRQDEAGFSLEEFSSTHALCQRGTLHNHFASNLSMVNGAHMQGSNLRLTTDIEGVYVEMEPLDSL